MTSHVLDNSLQFEFTTDLSFMTSYCDFRSIIIVENVTSFVNGITDYDCLFKISTMNIEDNWFWYLFNLFCNFYSPSTISTILTVEYFQKAAKNDWDKFAGFCYEIRKILYFYNLNIFLNKFQNLFTKFFLNFVNLFKL